MKRAATLLALAVMAVPVLALAQTGPATQKAVEGIKDETRGKAEIPVRRVVLFTSGLGFFEHEGAVEGNVQMDLVCRSDEFNDVLKSLVTQDTDGSTSGARYTLPVASDKPGKDVPTDMMTSSSIAELLGAARGAEITVTVGTTTVTGKIIGVEDRAAPMTPVERDVGGLRGADDRGATPTTTTIMAVEKKAPPVLMLNLLLEKGTIRSIRLTDVSSFTFTDPKLQKGLAEALEASSHKVDTDHKAVSVLFDGKKKRDVRLAYTVEMPVWKMSYRLILPEAGSKEKARLQGWAIVENDTESDWTDVKLSMVGGRPLSFVENLYSSYYIPRPVVQPRAIVPRDPQGFETDDTGKLELLRQRFEMYRTGRIPEGGLVGGGVGGGGGLFNAGGGNNSINNNGNNAGPPEAKTEKSAGGKTEEGFGIGVGAGAGANDGGRVVTPPNYAQGVQAMADVEKVGEFFQYDLGKVTVKKKQASMVPVMTDPAETERLCIYNPAVLGSHAMLGVKLVNTGDHYLLSGPVTVMEGVKAGSVYIGDARIADTAPKQKRYVSYAVDQDVRAKMGEPVGRQSLVSIIVGEQNEYVMRQTVAREYEFINRSGEAKTIIVEKAREHPDYTLDSPAVEETTDIFHRFRVPAPASKTTKLEVVEALPELRTVGGTADVMDSFNVKATVDRSGGSQIVGASIRAGRLTVEFKQTDERQVVVENQAAEARDLSVSSRRHGPDDELVSPAAVEKTEIAYTFKMHVDAGKTAKLKITQTHKAFENLWLRRDFADKIEAYIKNPSFPAKVREGLVRMQKLWKEADAIAAQLSAKQTEKAEVSEDEVRIRANVAADKESEFHSQQIKALQVAEDKLNKLTAEIKKLKDDAAAKKDEAQQVVEDMTIN